MQVETHTTDLFFFITYCLPLAKLDIYLSQFFSLISHFTTDSSCFAHSLLMYFW